MILTALARVQRSFTCAGHAPIVASRQEVVTASVLGVDIDAVALGTATQTYTYHLNTKNLCSLSYTPAHDHTNLRDTAGRDDKAKNVAFTVDLCI